MIMVLAGWWVVKIVAGSTSASYPNRPIQIVVPYKAGGGSDTFLRIVQKGLLEDALLY